MKFNEFLKSSQALTIDNYLLNCFDIEINKPEIVSDYYNKFYTIPNFKENFIRIQASEKAVPKLGDIIIWDGDVYDDSLIEIATGKTYGSQFISYDKDRIETKHSYNNVLGYLRPKDQIVFKKEEPKIEQPKVEEIKEESKVKVEEESKVEVKANTDYFGGRSYDAFTTYELVEDMRLRSGAGVNYNQLTREQLPYKERRNTIGKPFATFKKGTKITPIKIIKLDNGEVWAKLKFGYVLLKNNEREFIK